jgi:hypothetical protein
MKLVNFKALLTIFMLWFSLSDSHDQTAYVFLACICGLASLLVSYKGRFTHSMPRLCRAAKGLECVFPIRFTQCGRVWFTLAMPCPCHAPTMPFFSRPRHSTAVEGRPFCVVALKRTAWSEHGTGVAQVWIRQGRTIKIKWESHILNL